MKICLIHPPHFNSTDDRLDPPMGLLYIASMLRENNYDVSITDLSGTSTFDIPYADVYGITAYISSLSVNKQIVDTCRQINPNAIVVVGGAHPTAQPDDFDYVDYIVRGYGEEVMLSICRGEVKSRIVDGPTQNWNYIFPSYDLIDVHSYSRTIEGKPSLPYITSRGCPFKCNFCGLSSIHVYNKKVSMVPPEIVYEHISRIKTHYGISHINFQDDIFTLDKKRLYKILDLIKKLDIRFKCMGRAGYDDEEVYERLADSGCVQVSWGIESGSQLILDRMNKCVTVEDNYNVISWAKKYGINTRAFFIIGFPGETKETIEETKRFIIDADPDQCFVSNFIPYPGTPVYENYRDFGIIHISDNKEDYYQVSKDGTGGIVISTEWLSKDDFRCIEVDFRKWIRERGMRGFRQKYEMSLYK